MFEQAKHEQEQERERIDSPIKSVFTVGRRPFLRTFALNIGGNTQSVRYFSGATQPVADLHLGVLLDVSQDRKSVV